MNSTNAKDYLPLVQSLADGKTVQWLTNAGEWQDVGQVDFCDTPSSYRIKPEPRRFFVSTDALGYPSDVYTSSQAAAFSDKSRLVEVVEVLK